MGEETLLDKIKGFASYLGWKLILWDLGMSQESYWSLIYDQEKRHRGEKMLSSPICEKCGNVVSIEGYP